MKSNDEVKHLNGPMIMYCCISMSTSIVETYLLNRKFQKMSFSHKCLGIAADGNGLAKKFLSKAHAFKILLEFSKYNFPCKSLFSCSEPFVVTVRNPDKKMSHAELSLSIHNTIPYITQHAEDCSILCAHQYRGPHSI